MVMVGMPAADAFSITGFKPSLSSGSTRIQSTPCSIKFSISEIWLSKLPSALFQITSQP